MSLASALRGWGDEPEPSGTQVPKHPGTQAPKPLGSQAPGRLGAQVPKSLSTQAPKSVGTQVPKPLSTQGTGKCSHPDYKAFKVYLRTATKIAALRKFQDETGSDDFSELCEQLLAEWMKGA